MSQNVWGCVMAEEAAEAAWRKAHWLESMRPEWQRQRKQRAGLNGALPRPAAPSRAPDEQTESKAEWLASQRAAWNKAYQRRERAAAATTTEKAFCADTPDDATIKRFWLAQQRLLHSQAMTRRGHLADGGLVPAPVDAALLSAPCERDAYLQRLHEQREASQRERRERAAEGLRRPAVQLPDANSESMFGQPAAEFHHQEDSSVHANSRSDGPDSCETGVGSPSTPDRLEVRFASPIRCLVATRSSCSQRMRVTGVCMHRSKGSKSWRRLRRLNYKSNSDSSHG